MKFYFPKQILLFVAILTGHILQAQNIADESQPKPPEAPSSLKVAIFTDFKGFSGDYPNGLVQTALEGNFNLNSHKNAFTLFKNFHCGINLTKLEDNLRYKQLLYGYDSVEMKSIKHLHYLDLIRYQNYEAFAKLNIVTIDFNSFGMFKKPIEIYFDLYSNFISTGVKDSTLTNSEKENQFTTTSIGIGGSVKIKTRFIRTEQSHFDFSLGYNYYQLYNTSNNFIASGGPLLYPESNPLNNQYVVEDKIDGIHKFEFMIHYCKDYAKNDNRIFLRTMLHMNRLSRDFRDLPFKHNTYLQVQLGYSAPIDEILPTKKDD